ncbi:hypothetical protein E2P81_ATG05059 [Venturia nashicola]|uniref:Uncharacterized protein n=1 Tax=Venturia nashicola TaxID=86259 RepID=A0A4Z1P226_9PEZI|nr:hypothetical protein E6O75_ATG05185 [Venturia nashicola]TLD34894.1 hypothetical protein E2P81_ATG05059 [Venturia nashicola]
MSTCSRSINGLLSQNFIGSNGTTESLYSCAFASNLTQASPCCKPDIVHPFSEDPCYSWCDLPTSLNSQFDSGELDYFQYFKACLNSTGEDIRMLWCHAQPHIIANPTPTTTMSVKATSTFDSAGFCKTNDAQSLIAVNDPLPACGILPSTRNSRALEVCCQPSAVKYSVVHCYEYCPLPRGNGFRGVGNLTYDQALGSFKTCLQQYGNETADVFDGIFCRVNGSVIDLKGTVFGTTRYLTGGGGKRAERVGWALILVVLGLWMFAC